LRQHGVDLPMKRIDAATAQRIAGVRIEQPTEKKGMMGGALIIEK